MLLQRALRLFACGLAVGAVTFLALRVVPVNATTTGFAYVLLVLVVASTWGFAESAATALLATVLFNYYFLPPVRTFTVADPQNWVALFSLLATSLIASRLSATAKLRTLEALERRQDVERLYSLSRAILLINGQESFQSQLIRTLAETFEMTAVVLYDRRMGEFFRAGPVDLEGLDQQLRDSAVQGTSFSDAAANRFITAIRLGSEPIASLAVQGVKIRDAVLQGIGNLVAIGLEKARAQETAQEVEAARQSEQLRTTLIDAMAHELKTPLTLIKGATSSILADGDSLSGSAREQLTIADEEAEYLRELLDSAIEMARLDTARIDVHLEMSALPGMVKEVAASVELHAGEHRLTISADEGLGPAPLDRRLVKIALKQLFDNAFKYSPPDETIEVEIASDHDFVCVDVTDHGNGIAPEEQKRIFERFYRGQAVRERIPGTGLGLTIAHSIARAHNGDLTVTSRPGNTTFRLKLPSHAAAGPE